MMNHVYILECLEEIILQCSSEELVIWISIIDITSEVRVYQENTRVDAGTVTWQSLQSTLSSLTASVSQIHFYFYSIL